MKNIKLLFIFISLLNTFSPKAFSQTFEKMKISEKEKSNGMLFKYQKSQGETIENLQLYSGGTFFYENINMGGNSFSKGKWGKKGETLILSSLINKNNIPIKVKFTYDTSLADKFKLNVVRDLKNNPMEDAILCLNADTIRCIPLVECSAKVDFITKVKLVFGNRLS